MAGYDFATGKRLWTLSGAGDAPVPTPVVAHGLVFLTSSHGPLSPAYAVRLSAEPDRGGRVIGTAGQKGEPRRRGDTEARFYCRAALGADRAACFRASVFQLSTV